MPCAPHPGRLNLKHLYLDFAQGIDAHGRDEASIVTLPDHEVAIQPSLLHEVHFVLEPICSYPAGTKVLVTLQHEGATTFRDFELRLEPDSAVAVSKHVRRAELRPGDSECFEAVVTPGEIDFVLVARTDFGRTEQRHRATISAVAVRDERPPFRFLEPRQLSMDAIVVRDLEKRGAPPVTATNAAFPMVGGRKYQITITPQQATAQRVRLRDVPGMVRVLKEASREDTRAWTFEVDITGSDLLSKLERIVYDVDAPDRPASGEIAVRIDPPLSKYGKLGVTAGAAITLQGAFTLFEAFKDSNISLVRRLTELSFTRDYELWFFPLAIPAIVLTLLAINRLKCWLFL